MQVVSSMGTTRVPAFVFGSLEVLVEFLRKILVELGKGDRWFDCLQPLHVQAD